MFDTKSDSPFAEPLVEILPDGCFVPASDGILVIDFSCSSYDAASSALTTFAAASGCCSSSGISYASGSVGAALAASSASLRLRASSLAMVACNSLNSLSFSSIACSREWNA